MEKRKDALQWHPAFYADIQIELREEAHKLIFQNEYPLGRKPMLIDILAVKKKAGEKIHKNIGRIFRTYNLIEYKSPKDYMSVDDFYKVYGYACFYKADTGQVNEIPAEEITITFVSKNYPRKMIRHLVQRIINNWPNDLSDFSSATLSSVAVATATPSSSALHMKKSFYVIEPETYFSLY